MKLHTFLIVTGITGFYMALALLPDLRPAVPFVVFATAGITVLLALHVHITETNGNPLSPWLILSVAALLRFLFVFRTPELSDDIYRYLWDGLRMITGHNPYDLAPAAVVPEGISATRLQSLVNHSGLVTVYPPGAQIVFGFSSLFGHSARVLKSLLSLMDLGTCALIIRILRKLGQPVSRSILYAWHPLAVLEIAGSGHIDAAGIFFLLLTLALAFGISKPGRVSLGLAGGFFAWACLTKLYPVVAFPLFFLALPKARRPVFTAGFIAGGLLLCLPFLPGLFHMADTLSTYTRHWEFSGLSFYWLKRWGLSGDLSRMILAGTFGTFVLLLLIRLSSHRESLIHGFFKPLYMVNLAFLFLTPTLHPWYALYLVLMLPFVPRVTGLVLSWSVFLAYSVQIPYALTGVWAEHSLSTHLIWAGPLAAGLSAFAIKRLGKTAIV